MLQLNPNEVIRLSKLINNSIDTLDEDIMFFKHKYDNDHNKLAELELENIEKLTQKIEASTLFLTNVTNEIVEATGESLDKLLSSNHTLNYYEGKLISHYANNINNKSSKVANIDLCYSKDDRLTNYCQKRNFISYAEDYFNKFDPEKYGLSKDTIMNDLLVVYDKRGASEAYAIMRALENNAPSNYYEYNFKPTTLTKTNSYYDFNGKTINNYQTNSEIINVNGYDYEIVEVLPKDCTKTEELAYNFGKANILNTMKTLPDKYLKLCSKGDSNVITLTCDKAAMNNNSNWSGYYKPSSFFGSNNNSITIDIHGSFNDNTFYTQDTLIHEMGHKFDDMSKSKSIIDWILGKTSYTKSSDDWEEAYKKYNNVLSGINLGGYTTYPNVSEFYGDATVAYFKNPNEVKSLCPEVYDLMNEMLDGEYGYSYNDKIVQVLSAN